MRRHLWVIGVLALGLLAPTTSQAHDAATYYPYRWQSTSQTWNFTAGFPPGAFRTRVRDGVNQWNAQSANFNFVEGGQVANYSSLTCPEPGRNGVHSRAIDGRNGTLAETLLCPGAGGSLLSANIAFDSGETWNTATTPPINSIDAWSVASHEWGHATGHYGPYANGHFNPNESICTAGSPQTMCPYYVAPTATDPKMRTLGAHDIDTFNSAYPLPPPAVTWYLNSGFDAQAETAFGFGAVGDLFVVGDWDGNGTETPGLFRGNTWLLNNGFDGTADIVFNYGASGDKPVVGDWDKDGDDTPGVVRGNIWYLNNGFDGTHDVTSFAWGASSTDKWLAGDWGGGLLNMPDDIDTPGIFRPANSWFLNNNFDGTTDVAFNYGSSGDKPVVGDWNNDGRDSVGVVRGNIWYLNNAFDSSGDVASFGFGSASDTPMAGDWNGDGTATPGVVRVT